MNEHRRRHRRVGVALWAIEHGAGFSSWHRVSNISKDGLFFETAIPLPSGMPCILEIELAEGRSIRATTTVVHATASEEEVGVGVAILDIAPEDRMILDHFLEMRLGGELEGSLSEAT